MKFNILINDETIRKAAAIVMTHYKDQAFLNSLSCIEKFNFTNDSGVDIARKIKDSSISLRVEGYTPKYWFSKAIAREEDGAIFFNYRKMNMPLKDRVETLYHESLHGLNYKHDGNRANAFNMKTAPYAISALFVKYLESIGRL